MKSTKETHERVRVVGAGPAGLVMARQLREAGIEFDLYERHSDVGGIWDPENTGSPIYRSTHFISHKNASGFYGYPMYDDMADYPSWQSVLKYIRDFAAHENLYEHISFNSNVEAAEMVSTDEWNITINGVVKRYRALVVAPGVTWHANVPEVPGMADFNGRVMHSSEYFDLSEFHGKRVLVVGAGNSGVDIACDAAAAGDHTFLSVRRGYRFIPKFVFGTPVGEYFRGGAKLPDGVSVPKDPNQLIDALVGDLTRYGLPAPDHDAYQSHPIVNDQVVHYLRHGDITAKPDVARLNRDHVEFVDGTQEEIDVVVLATGFHYKIPFLPEDYFEWKGSRPDLYLNVFNRNIDSLYVVGFIEFADAAYKRFEEMAQLVALDLTLNGAEKEDFTSLKRNHRPNLRGNMEYIDSPRHNSYVDSRTYQKVMAEIRDRFGITAPEAAASAHPAVPVT